MLVEFSVENFKSFREKVTLSMIPVFDRFTKNEIENYFEYSHNKFLLKSAVIYGANASGKTNLLMALEFMSTLVKKSQLYQKDEKIDITPFKLHPQYSELPSKFDVQFIYESIKYAYGFMLNENKIIEEYLYYWPHGKQRVVFERFQTNEYRFVKDKSKQNTISELTAENTLYFTMAAKLNYPLVTKPFEWFSRILQCSIESTPLLEKVAIKEVFENEDLQALSKEILNIADFGIYNIKPIEIDFDETRFPKNLPKNLKELLSYDLTTFHKAYIDENKEFITAFSLDEESKGTRRFFSLIVQILDVLASGGVLCIDELEGSLHPLLTQFIIDSFHDPSTNKYNAQLIFTTHDTNLLNKGLFRRDQIWLTEKYGDTGATDLYSLVELKINKDENFQKGYLMGRYGAIPFISGGDFFA
ncbi:AAA family ATPase [Calidifontibacillus oryziterrae]|uniref:AAA family ATPase n=1 Tax=Calidifontibacillus oryziterrae TaxID=1191699 RepID=UPI0002DC220D|nr:ATP-binding protein [Calidifontibacillus oryziterrae]